MKILIVEDDPTSLLVLKSTVTHLGHECLTANDGLDAWALLQTTPVEVVISDWIMPGLSGLELCRHVRSDPRISVTYFILLTGMQREDDIRKGELAGADAYMTKPVNRADLKSLLDSVVQTPLRLHGDNS